MKVIIVEDEFLAQQELSWLIKTHSQMEIVGTFDDGLDVLKFCSITALMPFFLISTFRRWMAYYWRKTSISLPISRLLSSSPPEGARG